MKRLPWIVVVAACACACGGSSRKSDGGGGSAAPAVPGPPKDAPPGLDLRVSHGDTGAPVLDRAPRVPATKLADADVAALLARAPAFEADPTAARDFALRPGSQPAPRTGETIQGAFPPDPSTLLPPKPADAGDALRVLRYAPEGEVPIAPQLSVTFSQPMVAVTSQDDAAKVQPVVLAPQPPGAWRWIGTRTILFDPVERFPQATTYKVEIPAGTKGVAGAALAAPAAFTFETPPPTIVASWPSSGPQHVDTPMFVRFDQKIDAQAVLAKLRVTANGQAQTVRLLAPAELDAVARRSAERRDGLAHLIDAAREPDAAGRWLAFRAAAALPPDAAIEVTLPAGTPSAEGPNPTKQAQAFSFRTYPPLAITEARCGYQECRPGWAFQIRFSNPLDEDKWSDAHVTVRPAIPGMKLVAQHATLTISGATTARTTYEITIAGGVTDEFGQTLGAPQTRKLDVGDAAPTFYGPSGLVVLDPAAVRRTLDFFTTNYDNLIVKLHKVTPDDWHAYQRWAREMWRDDPPPVPGKALAETRPATGPDRNALVENRVDLAPALDAAGLGHVLAIVEPSPWPHSHRPPRHVAWVQATKLGVDAHVDRDQLVAFATELDTGKPAAGVRLELRPDGATATTDARGVATIPLAPHRADAPSYLIARRGADVAFVADHGYGGARWTKRGDDERTTWFVFDDRQLYRPGEQVSLKGWLRTVQYGKTGDVAAHWSGLSTISYVVRDARNNELAKGQTEVAPTGGFDLRFTLPATPNLGHARVELSGPGTSHTHRFRIEEFRRPEFEVTAQASQGPHLVGGTADVTVTARYFAGGGLPGADTTWAVSAAPARFAPPNREGARFRGWSAWWRTEVDGDHDVRPHGRRGRRAGPRRDEPMRWELAGKTDSAGAHVLHLELRSAKPARPMTVTANATVMDVNRQAWAAQTSLLVHPSTRYVGLKAKQPFVERGVPFELDVIGVDLDGKLVPGAKIAVVSKRLDWKYEKGAYVPLEVEPQTCDVTVARGDERCKFDTKTGGTYRVTAVIGDDRGYTSETELEYWVSGGDTRPSRNVEREVAQLIPDKPEYAPGDTARILIQAPFAPAEGLVTWRRGGIVKVERISLTGATHVVEVPITDAMTPNVRVHVDLVGATARLDDKGQQDPKLPPRPAYAVGAIDLPIPPNHRALAVAVTPAAAKLAPAERTTLAVEVRDARGQPVADAEAAVVVVDEAVLALTGHQFADPIGTFYPRRGAETTDHYLRQHVKLSTLLATQTADGAPDDGEAAGSTGMALEEGRMNRKEAAAPGRARAASPAPAPAKVALADDGDARGGGGGRDPGVPIAVRTNFNPLAVFSPVVRTDAAGKATVEVALPDNLTRYRVVAIAVAGTKQYGKGESAITARLPLMVRPSPPRFLNFGDTFQLPVVVQNQTDAPMTVRLAARTTNAALTAGAGREVSVPPNDRVEVRFPAAAELAGTARFQLVGAAGAASDAAEVALPVWTPATTEAFATYGVLDDGATRQPVALPGKVVTQFGGLEVTTASTNLQALTDAVIYLVRYPYECAEQRASRVLAVAALRDVLAAFRSEDLPPVAALEASVAADLERLAQVQNPDGGFAFWERGRPSEPYLSVFVTHALARARAKGFAVPQAVLDRARPYLADVERHYPPWYGKQIRDAISSFALYTRKQYGDVDVAKALRVLAGAGGPSALSMEANGWLLGTLAGQAAAVAERKAIVRHALNKVSETAGAANFTTSYGDGAYVLLASDRRVDSVMLEALIQEQPELDLIPKVVTGLLAHRKAGRWLNTQENVFALSALDLYFHTYEKVTPSFVARVWLGDGYAGEHAFRGRTTEQHAIHIPMKEVAARDGQALTIQKDGKGRLYYRIGMTYAPADLSIPAADHGFVVTRAYEGVDDPADVTRLQDGAWKIKAGARVRVKLTMVNENRRYHVALVDPLPAGLEPMNPALAVTGPIPTDPKDQQARGAYWWWYGPWYEHQNMRDERVEAFAALLWEGMHAYSYVARATTPGRFVVPPPKAEEMYMPETFGRGASDRVIVE